MNEITKLETPHKVAVIGAGPGGLEAARTAALRGCSVTIFEKSGQIGGTLIAIATASWKIRIRQLIEWYSVQLKKLGVDIRLNTEVSADDPALADYDDIFVAVGAVPMVPKSIAGTDLPNVIDVTNSHRQGVHRATMW